MSEEDKLAKTLQIHQVNTAGIVHPNIQGGKTAIDPDRPLTDIPEPAPRYHESLQNLLADNQASHASFLYPADQSDQSKYGECASMWELIASPELASHLELLQLGGLINLPPHFFEPISAADAKGHLALLAPLTQMTLLDMSDIQRTCDKYPTLTRYGFATSQPKFNSSSQARAKQNHLLKSKRTQTSEYNSETAEDSTSVIAELASSMPEMINDVFAPNWELILYPERFDNGVDSLITDILACSVAVHILKQCQSRQSINRALTAKQICQFMRSYVLNQCNSYPQFEKQYRQIRLFTGHVVVAADYLGFDIVHAAHHAVNSVTNSKGKTSENLGQPIYINVSSRSSLFCRYPNISSYYINGWS